MATVEQSIFGRLLPLHFGEGGLITTYNGARRRKLPMLDATVSSGSDAGERYVRVNFHGGDTRPVELFAAYLAVQTASRVKLTMNNVDLTLDGREGITPLVAALTEEQVAAIHGRFTTVDGIGSLSAERKLQVGARALALHEEFCERLRETPLHP